MSEQNLNFRDGALLMGLRQLFDRSYFCWSSLDSLLQLAQIQLSPEEKAPFRAVHCVDYGKMPAEFKKQLFEQVVAVFRKHRGPDWNIEELEGLMRGKKPAATDLDAAVVSAGLALLYTPPRRPQRSWFGRLLG